MTEPYSDLPGFPPPSQPEPERMSEPSRPKRQNPGRAPAQRALPLLMVLAGLGLVLLAAGALLLDSQLPRGTGSASSAPRVGRPLADFALKDLNGQTVRLSDFAGRPVLINAWATWCPPCRAEMPALNALYQAHRADGFVILAVNAGEPRDLAASFAEEMGLSFPILLDQDYTLIDRLLINNYPTSILVGRDGLVKLVHIGLLDEDEIEDRITPLISD